MTILKYIIYIFFLSVLNLDILNGQTPDISSRQEVIHQQVNMLTGIHDSFFNSGKDLINGKVYYSGGNKFVHPFYADNSWKPAKIFTQGEVYEMDLIKYDICLDYLVMLYHTDSLSYPICLNKEFVKEFIIYGHHFRYLEDFNGSDPDGLIPGYYEVQYDGETMFIIRRIKLKTFDNSSLADTYSDRIRLFLKKDNKYFSVTGQKSLIKILNDHRKEIKAFLKNGNIRISQDNYEQAGKVLEYYDTL